MQEETYSKSKGINQSSIKAFRYKSPRIWYKHYIEQEEDPEQDNPSFTLGDLIDTLCFSSRLLDSRFFIANIPKLPSDSIKHIVDCVYKEIQRKNSLLESIASDLPTLTLHKYTLETNSDIILSCANTIITKDAEGKEKQGWNTQWKEETRLSKIIESGKEYFDSLVLAKNRKVISTTTNLQGIELVKVLQTHERCKDYFVESKGNELIFQLEIFINYTYKGKEIPLKGALDILRINHTKKTIQVIDFKKSFSAFNFVENVKKYGYCDQISYYLFLLKEWIKVNRPELLQYKIIEPINITIDINERVPYIYEYNWKDIDLARIGNESLLYDIYQGQVHNQKIRKGWQSILEDICWHITKNIWSEPRELYETNKIKINLLNN